MGDKRHTKPHGLFYASHGMVFIAVNYRLSPDIQHPAHIEDCAAAVAWVFEHLHHLGGDAKQIFLSGHSAGAHLAALLATDPSYLHPYRLTLGTITGVIPVDTASFNLLSASNERLVTNFIQQTHISRGVHLKHP